MAPHLTTLPFFQRRLPCAAPATMLTVMLSACLIGLTGCQDDSSVVRDIQSKRQAKQQQSTQQDHLGETFALLRDFVDLDERKAGKQIAFHLNRWSETKPDGELESPAIIKSIREVVQLDQLRPRLENATFQPQDSRHLRDCFLFHSLYNWVDTDAQDEPLLADWLASMEQEIGEENAEQLRTATRLFDWTVRNIAVEPDEQAVPPKQPKFPLGMTLSGAGYRQTDYETLMRGTGDGLQRAGIFTQLCRQADIPSAVLATIDAKTGSTKPFCVGVLIGDDIYLFETRLGVFVPGPGQVGIATLAQARRDALVLRRMSIAGLDQFKYPLTKDDVQQCAALLNVTPECVSPRMKKLQGALTGDRRMNVYVDADALAEQFDAVTGISSVRMWDIPLKAEVFRATCDAYAERDPAFAFWYIARWAMMDAEFEMAEMLSRGRWRHLTGQFADEEEEGIEGARSLYLAQRAPEFEIEDLRIDVDLQKAYGIRRELGMDSRMYDQQVQQIQLMMRMGKRTATYWLSLLQADDGRYETAESWIRKRVLNEEQSSYWVPAARFNMARLAERLGETDRAIELYKRENEPQEHGNRIRARLVARAAGA